MRLLFMVPLRNKPSVIEFSPSLPMCALGYDDGQIQLIEIIGRQPKEIVNPHSVEQHIHKVVGLTFCDDLKAFCSSCVSGELKVWDLGNRLLDRVILNKEPKVLFFNGGKGDVVVGQGNYLLKVEKETWLPPGGMEALEKANRQLAVMKLQARFRGSSIRRILGTGVQSKVMDHTYGDDTEDVVVGIDGSLRRWKKKEDKVEDELEGAEEKKEREAEEEMRQLIGLSVNDEKGGGGEGEEESEEGEEESKEGEERGEEVEEEEEEEEVIDRRDEFRRNPKLHAIALPPTERGSGKTKGRRLGFNKHRKLISPARRAGKKSGPYKNVTRKEEKLGSLLDTTTFDVDLMLGSITPSLDAAAKRYTDRMKQEQRIETSSITEALKRMAERETIIEEEVEEVEEKLKNYARRSTLL